MGARILRARVFRKTYWYWFFQRFALGLCESGLLPSSPTCRVGEPERNGPRSPRIVEAHSLPLSARRRLRQLRFDVAVELDHVPTPRDLEAQAIRAVPSERTRIGSPGRSSRSLDSARDQRHPDVFTYRPSGRTAFKISKAGDACEQIAGGNTKAGTAEPPGTPSRAELFCVWSGVHAESFPSQRHWSTGKRYAPAPRRVNLKEKQPWRDRELRFWKINSEF